MEQRGILNSWIDETVEKPDLKIPVAVDEIHFYKKLDIERNKWLKVVVNPKNNVIVTAYFDRNKAKKESK